MCASLKTVKKKEKLNMTSHKSYSFDITKADQVFEVLLRDKQIIFPKGKKMPFIGEIRNRNFCKFHQIVDHSSNNCVHFRDLIQKAIKDRRLKFEKKANPKKVDIESFEVDSNYVELVSLPINMVGINEQEVDKRKPQSNTKPRSL